MITKGDRNRKKEPIPFCLPPFAAHSETLGKEFWVWSEGRSLILKTDHQRCQWATKGWSLSETPEPPRNTANGMFQRKNLWIFHPGVADICRKPRDLRSKTQSTPSQPCPSFPWFLGFPWLILRREFPWLFW